MSPDSRISRRRFNLLGTQAAGAAIVSAFLAPIVGWTLSPLFQPRPTYVWRSIGRVNDIPLLTPTARSVEFPHSSQAWTPELDRWIVYVVRYPGGTLRTFSNICTHMQCPVRWEPAIGQFLCPCHGGLYNIYGTNVGGPPPLPLPRWIHRIEPDGTVMVQDRLDEELP
jgi:menaquinol-cytochrome c reductase iron-sulfur subunit